MKKKFKVFLSPIEGQERWLNNKAQEGLKLINTGRFFYTFHNCKPNEYQYAVDYVGNKGFTELKEYQKFLDEIGINFYEKPLNIGQFSWGKMKLRPYANTKGKIATSKGMINKELLILEKRNDGKEFEIYSNMEDRIYRLREIRKPLLFTEIIIIFFMVMPIFIKEPVFEYTLWSIGHNANNYLLFGLLGIVFIISLIKLIQINMSIKDLENKAKLNE